MVVLKDLVFNHNMSVCLITLLITQLSLRSILIYSYQYIEHILVLLVQLYAYPL